MRNTLFDSLKKTMLQRGWPQAGEDFSNFDAGSFIIGINFTYLGACACNEMQMNQEKLGGVLITNETF